MASPVYLEGIHQRAALGRGAIGRDALLLGTEFGQQGLEIVLESPHAIGKFLVIGKIADAGLALFTQHGIDAPAGIDEDDNAFEKKLRRMAQAKSDKDKTPVK